MKEKPFSVEQISSAPSPCSSLIQELVSSPSDLNHFVECEHLTALDLLAIDGNGVAKKAPQADILSAMGFGHEQTSLPPLSSGQSFHSFGW